MPTAYYIEWSSTIIKIKRLHQSLIMPTALRCCSSAAIGRRPIISVANLKNKVFFLIMPKAFNLSLIIR